MKNGTRLSKLYIELVIIFIYSGKCGDFPSFPIFTESETNRFMSEHVEQQEFEMGNIVAELFNICKKDGDIFECGMGQEEENQWFFFDLLLLDYFKDQEPENSNKIGVKAFLHKFNKFKDCILNHDFKENVARQIKNILSLGSDGVVENEYLDWGAKGKKFFAHYTRKNEILEESFLLYAIMYTLWLYGRLSTNEKIKKYRERLLSYRKKTGSCFELMEVIYWCIQGCKDFVDETGNLLEKDDINITLAGINFFLSEFQYFEVMNKYCLKTELIWEFGSKEKAWFWQYPSDFMLGFDIQSRSSKRPFIGKMGKAYIAKDNKVCRRVSGNHQFVKKYLKKYFAPQFDEEITYLYFQIEFDNPEQTQRSIFSAEELEKWRSISYNFFVSSILIMLNPSPQNCLSLYMFLYLKTYVLGRLRELAPDVESRSIDAWKLGMYIFENIEQEAAQIQRWSEHVIVKVEDEMKKLIECEGNKDIQEMFLEMYFMLLIYGDRQ